MEKKRLVIGPSHIVRWAFSIDHDVIPDIKNTEFLGKGGLPLWCDLVQLKKNEFHLYDEIIYLVGDFRFGNKSIVKPSDQFGIDKDLINKKNDKYLYNKVIDEMLSLVNGPFAQKIKFIFWDLAMRENENKNKNKYLKEGVYCHPLWNLNELQSKFSSNTIFIDNNFRLDSLYIDSSNHPSILGYRYIYELIHYNKSNLMSFLDPYPSFKLRDIKIIGDSRIIEHINSYCDKGILDKTYKKEVIKLSQLDDYLSENECDVFFISNVRNFNDNNDAFIKRINNLFLLKNKYGSRLNVIFWEAFSQEVISTRQSNYDKFCPENVLFKFNSIASIFGGLNFYPDINSIFSQSLVELNVGLQPTFKGIFWALSLGGDLLVDVDKSYSIFRNDIFHF